jgi:hypothetical protein
MAVPSFGIALFACTIGSLWRMRSMPGNNNSEIFYQSVCYSAMIACFLNPLSHARKRFSPFVYHFPEGCCHCTRESLQSVPKQKDSLE